MNKNTLNETAWSELFKVHSILQAINQTGTFTITANEIKSVREPRLMTKFDHANQLPSIFTANRIALLPATRGTYVLGRFEIFHTLEPYNLPAKSIPFPTQFETLDFNKITSETAAISCAFLSNILEDFLGEPVTPTVSGRMSSDTFSFAVSGGQGVRFQLSVDRAQIEIDAGFEGVQSFALVEAKNHLSDDLLIRQLYYPYRKWEKLIQKPIRNIFMTYSNGVFELREYSFLSLLEYNAINLVQCQKYAICNTELNIETLAGMIVSAAPEDEPDDVPFPQANAFERVINLCELLVNDEPLTKADITENYGFDSRQTDYYANACKYLELLEIDDLHKSLTLSATGKGIFRQPTALRTKLFIEQLLKRRAFKDTLALYLQQATPPTNEQIVEIMLRAHLDKKYSQDTLHRRASTVRAWVDWVMSQVET